MTRCLDRSKHMLVTDNWFSSIRVAEYCTSQNMAFVGAIKHFKGKKTSLLWPVRVRFPFLFSTTFDIHLPAYAHLMLLFLFAAMRLQKKPSKHKLVPGSAHMALHSSLELCIQQWVDAKVCLTFPSGYSCGVLKLCVRFCACPVNGDFAEQLRNEVCKGQSSSVGRIGAQAPLSFAWCVFVLLSLPCPLSALSTE